MAEPRERTTPLIRVRVQLPGKVKPERQPQLEEDPAHGSRILELTYESHEKGNDKIKLIVSNYDMRFPDDPIFDRGNLLVVSWGYVGNMCPDRECVITDWTPGHPQFHVEGQTRGVLMNRTPVDETYDGKTMSQVVTDIAKRNGYGPEAIDVEDSKIVHETLTQTHLTDGQFCMKMAKKIGWQFHVDGNGLHFHPRRYGQKPRRAFSYWRDGTGDLLSFPKFDKMPAAQPGAVTLKGIDSKTKKPFEVRADQKTVTDRPGLASVVEVIDVQTAQTALRAGAAREASSSTSSANADQAKQKAAGAFTKAQQNPIKCTAEAVGDPQFFAKSTAELRGLKVRLSGNYFANQVTHTVKPGDYKMQIKFTRDGTSGTGTKSTAKVQAGKAGTGAPGAEAFDTINVETAQTTTTFRPPK